MRIAIAVDTDIDIYSMDDVMWALVTRVNPQTDIMNPVPGGIGQTFQPITAGASQGTGSGTRFEGGIAIDGTVPFGYEEDFHRPEYPVQQVSLEKFFRQEQISKGRSFMTGWAKVLSKTGR
jgi:4-hydroxy-3-polyprenylbenzoate decarboxylase